MKYSNDLELRLAARAHERKASGTRWTGDGEGATERGLANAIYRTAWTTRNAQRAYESVNVTDYSSQRTNLALTGSPLTPEDIERILSPEFKVGGGK